MSKKVDASDFRRLARAMASVGDVKLLTKLMKTTNREMLKPIRIDFRGNIDFKASLTKYVGIRSDARAAKNKTAVAVGYTKRGYIIWWQDQGTVERYTKKGYFRGSIKPKNVLTRFKNFERKKLINATPKEYGDAFFKVLDRNIKRSGLKTRKI